MRSKEARASAELADSAAPGSPASTWAITGSATVVCHVSMAAASSSCSASRSG